MEAKELEVTCPCCSARLSLDVRTGSVLRFRSPDAARGAADRWQSSLEKVEKRDEAGREKFDASLERERNRERDLDDLFRNARKKVRPPDTEDS